MKTQPKKLNKKWKIDGFYFDGTDHWDIYKDEDGNIKNIKNKKMGKTC